MRRLSLSVLTMVLIPAAALAGQQANTNGTSILPPVAAQPAPKATDDAYKGGMTIMGGATMFKISSSASGGTSTTSDNATGFMGGIGVIKGMGGPVGLEFDAAYLQKGGASTVGATTYTYHDNYAEGSVLLRPAFKMGEQAHLFLLGGGAVGYYASCATSGGTSSSSCTIDSTAKRVDYGVVIGGGVQFTMIAVQVRYDLGLANLSSTSGVTIKNQGIMILGSVIF